MKNLYLVFASFGIATLSWAQPNDCNEAVQGCSTPSFAIEPPNAATNNFDFGTGTASNPSTNPGGFNSGCLLSGETSSTFITITVVSNGTLEWSMQGSSGFGCFDWIMWPYNYPTNGGVSTTCAMLQNGTQPPVACNWNGNCEGFTGMSNAPLPPGGDASNFQNALNVTAGQNFLLCLSNYSSASANVNLNFFGSAQVVCGVSAPDQTICQGNSTNVTIATPGYVSPTFNWLVTNGVSNTSGGTAVTVSPTVTTTYQVEVSQMGSGSTPSLIDTAVFTITVVPPPAPNAGPDQTVCLGQQIHLNGTANPASNTVSWQPIVPTGMTPPATATFSPNYNSLTPTITVNQPGTYKFILRESNSVCGMVRDTVVVTVSELNLTAAKVDPSCNGFSDGQITITSAGATEYSFNGGTTWQPAATQGGFAAGTYSVCARNALGCQKCITTTLVNPADVVVSVSNDTLICENGTANLVASATGGTSYEFNWQHTPSTSAYQPVSPATATTYTVVAENENGCLSAPASIDVTIRPPLSATITEAQYVCPGYPGTLTAIAAGGIGSPYTYTWNNPSATTQTGATSTITESPMSTTTYTVTIEDACESTPITISSDLITHELPVPAIDVDSSVKCEPASFDLVNITGSMSAGTIWNISNGQEFINMDSVTPDDLYAGTYDVQLIVVSPEGCIDSTTFEDYLTVLATPVADFKWSPDPILMFNTEALFTNYSTGAITYQWIFTGASPSGSTYEDPTVTFPDGVPGYYPVTLIATSYLGCVDSVEKIVPVMPEIIIYAPNAFTPDGDEFNQAWKIFIDGIDIYNFELLVYNRWGEVVWESHDVNAAWDGTYQGQIMPYGSYTWTLRTKDKLSDLKVTRTGNVTLIR